MRIASLDHVVLTVADPVATLAFYERLGMRREVFEDGRQALHFGHQKINLHRAGAEIAPNARNAVAGSGDLCFLIEGELDEVERLLESRGSPSSSGRSSRRARRGRCGRSTCATRTGTWSSSPSRSQPPSGARVSSPSTRRQIPSGFSSRSSGGSTAAGAFCHATGRRKRRIAVIPTDVCAGAEVAG